ncbi:MAG: PKD-like family lipoprotein [Ginsengibacter sp.]
MKWIYVFLSFVFLSSCYKDKGNYTYKEINEILIENFQPQYHAYYLKDTLKISPSIKFTQDSLSSDRYLYEWSLLRGGQGVAEEYKISHTRQLNFPVTVPSNEYLLVFKILDKETGITWMQKSNFTVSTYFDRGWLILGESQGHAVVDMISIPGSGDTVIIKDVMQNNGLKSLKGPRNIVSINNRNVHNPLYILTDDGTYELDKRTFASGEFANIKNRVYDVEKQSNFTAGDILQNFSVNRFMIGGDKLYINGSLSVNDSYANPASRYSTSKYSFKVAPYIAFTKNPMGLVQGRMLVYNSDDKRFVQFTPFSTFCDSLPDNSGDPFAWKTGMKMINLFNSSYVVPALGKMSYALMENDQGSRFLYTFTSNIVRKGKRYDVSALPGIKTMKHWGFSGTFPIMLYTSGSKLYGYNYETGFQFEKDFGKEITLLHFDTLLENNEKFYIATFDPSKSANTGGEITKFTVLRNPNAIEIEEDINVKWSGLSKVVSMTWKWF